MIIAPAGGGGDTKGILIDLDAAMDLANSPKKGGVIGSDGFMAIGVLNGDPHTDRHDLESLFYIFLWQMSNIPHKEEFLTQIPPYDIEIPNIPHNFI